MTAKGKARAGWSLATDVHRLLKNIDSFSGGQARVVDYDAVGIIHVAVIPDSGLYKDGEFKFNIHCYDGYPDNPPDVFCGTKIYHPNIDYDEGEECFGRVCLDILSDCWSPSMTLEDVVQGILFLLHNPNLEDPMSMIFTGFRVGEEEFAENVRQSLDGGWVGIFFFERNRVTRGEDGKIFTDGSSQEDGEAGCREEQLSKTVESQDARRADTAAEKTTDDAELKKPGSQEKGEEETAVIGVE